MILKRDNRWLNTVFVAISLTEFEIYTVLVGQYSKTGIDVQKLATIVSNLQLCSGSWGTDLSFSAL